MNDTQRLISLIEHYPSDSRAFLDRTPKPLGGYRELAKPNRSLATWLKVVYRELINLHFEWPDYIHARSTRSYVTFARPHIGKKRVITLDISECFPSVTKTRIASALSLHLGFTKFDAERLANLLCYKNRLAQGFSTSNFICNLVLLDALAFIYTELHAAGFVMTSYVDDLAISGDINEPGEVVNLVAKTLSRAGLKLNKAKIKVMPKSQRQVICGLQINTRLTVTSDLKKRLLSAATQRSMSKESLLGWVANLKNVDRPFSTKLQVYIDTYYVKKQISV